VLVPGAGSSVGRRESMDAIVGDLLATSGMPNKVAKSLHQYVRLKREDHNSPFEKARECIYDQPFYPLVTHFTPAFQPSSVARIDLYDASSRRSHL